jgi:hypothetical protein
VIGGVSMHLPALVAALTLAWRGAGGESVEAPKVLSSPPGGPVEAAFAGQTASLSLGQRLGPWTLMAVLPPGPGGPIAVFEDFSRQNGRLLFVDSHGVGADLPKSLEATSAEPSTLYRGHRLEEVWKSESDLLGDEILARPGDPDYDEVAACFPPISLTWTHTFVGTPDRLEKVGFRYGGASPNFDPAAYIPSIEKVPDDRQVLDGLVGGWLPILRFVYPEKPGDWSEMIAYAPFRIENQNDRVQPVWYRLVRVIDNEVRWARTFDSYHPFPPRTDPPAEQFYQELLDLREGWTRALEPAMKIDLPDRRLKDMARHSLVRAMITRVGAFPKYGVFDRGYAGSEHDGFPDTFNVDTRACLEWGLFERAGQYIDNYFGQFVRDDGSILYRGPETGQYGRMLTVAAAYGSATGDVDLLLRNRRRLDGVTGLLLSLRKKALELPAGDPAHGMISGWCEADACLDPDPPRYMQPYFSNSTEAARGFRDLGEVWEKAGRERGLDELASWGRRMVAESSALRADLETSIRRSILKDVQPPCLPSIAGAREPFHVAAARDRLDPQFRSYRAFVEMMDSGLLSREQVTGIVRYRSAHRDIKLGVPMAYGFGSHEMAGFLTYGHAFGLLQHDLVREYLLALDSIMAHQYTRGSWTAPETRNLDPKVHAAPYCTPAQLVVPLLVRWMLVLEDPASRRIWLARGTPRSWLADGNRISVAGAPTRWGRLGFSIASRLGEGKVEARVDLPDSPVEAPIELRLRAPEGFRIRSVTIGGEPWKDFDPEGETITLPPHSRGSITIEARYR